MNENIFLLKKDKIWLCCKNSVFTCVYQRKEERRKLFSFLFKTRVNIVKKIEFKFHKGSCKNNCTIFIDNASCQLLAAVFKRDEKQVASN